MFDRRRILLGKGFSQAGTAFCRQRSQASASVCFRPIADIARKVPPIVAGLAKVVAFTHGLVGDNQLVVEVHPSRIQGPNSNKIAQALAGRESDFVSIPALHHMGRL